MLKQAITYTDFDDNENTEVLYFNLTKVELAENLNLKDELENLQQDFTGDPNRNLEEHEIRRILDLVKTFMRLSYGVRSGDGKRFIKTPELWTEFTQTAAYDAFLFGLFEKPQNAVNFMAGILPKDLRNAAMEAAGKEGKEDIIREMQAAEAQRRIDAEKVDAHQDQQASGEAPVLGANPTQEELKAYMDWMKKDS